MDLSQSPLDLDPDELLDDLIAWADDDEGQDPNLLLAAWEAFEGLPSLEVLPILKRQVRVQFPPAEPGGDPVPVRAKVSKMKWTLAEVERVKKEAALFGVKPHELAGVGRGSWNYQVAKLKAKGL